MSVKVKLKQQTELLCTMSAPGESVATLQIKIAARLAAVDLLSLARSSLQVYLWCMPHYLTRSHTLQASQIIL